MRADTAVTLNDKSGRLTLLELVRKAAECKGLKLEEGSSSAYSEPIAAYTLDERLLQALAERGIQKESRPGCSGEIVTLVDTNPQVRVRGSTPSHYWNFQRARENNRFDLRVTLYVGFGLSTRERGIVLLPRARGTFLSPTDDLPNFRMFKALTDCDSKALPVARELAVSDGTIIVTWTELGLGGIRCVEDLFGEFARGNTVVERLARRQEVFVPAPYRSHGPPSDQLFIAEPAQPEVLRAWRAQLDAYRASLVV